MSRPGLGCPGLHRHRHDLDLCLLPFRVPGTFSSKKDHVRAQALLPAPLRPWFLPVLESATSLRQPLLLECTPRSCSVLCSRSPVLAYKLSPRPQSRLEPGRARCSSVWASVSHFWRAELSSHAAEKLKGPLGCPVLPAPTVSPRGWLVLVGFQRDSLPFHNNLNKSSGCCQDAVAKASRIFCLFLKLSFFLVLLAF